MEKCDKCLDYEIEIMKLNRIIEQYREWVTELRNTIAKLEKGKK